MRNRHVVGLGLVAATVVGLHAPRASACGGTFCNSGNPQQAIDQTGENIIFVMEPGKVEAHIQIQYKGTASSFSWVLPVQALPEIEVGSQALFDRVLAGTVPTYGYTTQQDFCGGSTGATGGFPGVANGGGLVDASASSDGGVNVVLEKTVGAFEVTVLEGGTTQEVLTWLTNNGYQAPTATPALLDGYVANHYLFVAVKLTTGAGVDEIHPLVVRYPGTQPCVPLKLTAVAAVEDMGVRTFFLGTKRVVPKNYKHVVPNPVMLDWIALGANYKTLISKSVDSPVANGRAFVTEYAGPSAVVGSSPLSGSTWNASVFASAAATDVMKLLQQQGLASCFTGFCNYYNPLLLPLLRDYLPAPAAVDGGVAGDVGAEGRFYSCMAGIGSPSSCGTPTIDAQKWDPAKFAAALSSRIIEPARHADALLTSWPYLTRLFTTISPAEMTEDPEFQEQDGLPTVRISGSGKRRITCGGAASGMTLPDGRQVALTPAGAWPGFSNQMPFAERIEEFPATGPSIVLVNNTERINSQLKIWNDSRGWPVPISQPFGTDGGGSDDAGANGTTGGLGSVGQGGSTGMGQGGSAGGAGPFLVDDHVKRDDTSSGCSYSAGVPASRSSHAIALVGLLGLMATRKRKRS